MSLLDADIRVAEADTGENVPHDYSGTETKHRNALSFSERRRLAMVLRRCSDIFEEVDAIATSALMRRAAGELDRVESEARELLSVSEGAA